MKKLVIVFILVVILTTSLFTLTGCSFTIETDENSVSASVDEDTQNTFENIIDWVVERLDRIFDNDGGSSSAPDTNSGEGVA